MRECHEIISGPFLQFQLDPGPRQKYLMVFNVNCVSMILWHPSTVANAKSFLFIINKNISANLLDGNLELTPSKFSCLNLQNSLNRYQFEVTSHRKLKKKTSWKKFKT